MVYLFFFENLGQKIGFKSFFLLWNEIIVMILEDHDVIEL